MHAVAEGWSARKSARRIPRVFGRRPYGRRRVALGPQNATGSLERLAHVASLLVIFHWEQQDFDAALVIAAESYEAHCRLCAVTPHYRRDLLLACNWPSHLRSVWISQEVVRVSDGALRRVHRGSEDTRT
jgi:hypothetical protein